MSLDEADEIVDHWQEEPPIGICLRSWLGAGERPVETPAIDVPSHPDMETPLGKEISPEMFERMVAAETAFADRFGRSG